MYNYLFIINPIAGKGKALRFIEYIERYMEENKLAYNLIYTEKTGQATGLVLENIEDYDVFVAVGGDGTIKEVAEGISKAGRGILASLPLGTGNDLAKVLYGGNNLEKALYKITHKPVRYIDVCRVNAGYFTNIGSIGFDAQVIVNYINMKKFSGRIKYFLAVVYSLFTFKYRNLKIDLDGEEYKGEITLLAMGNGSYYGGYFKVLPEAKLDDGFLHVCMVKKLGRLKIFLLAPFLLFGLHKPFKKYVKFYRVKNAKVTSKHKFYLNLDGEILESTNSANFYIGGKIPIIY